MNMNELNKIALDVIKEATEWSYEDSTGFCVLVNGVIDLLKKAEENEANLLKKAEKDEADLLKERIEELSSVYYGYKGEEK